MAPSGTAMTTGSVLQSNVDPRAESFVRNRDDMLAQLAVIDSLLDEAAAGGGERAHERLARLGKLPVRERIALVLDPDSPFLEISPLSGNGTDVKVGAGMVCGIGVISGVECVILANDPSVAAGALNSLNAKKWARAIEIARDNGIPYISFVESAGADLTVGGVYGSPESRNGKRPPMLTHFA